MFYKPEEVNYAAERLIDTWVRTSENKLIRVLHCDDPRKNCFRVQYEGLDGQIGNIRSSEVIFESPPLGNVNYTDCSMFVTRQALREDWRQGIRVRNLSIFPRVHLQERPFWIQVQENCLNNRFPTYFEAMDRTEDIFKSVAFTKHFSVNERGQLLYKNSKIVGECEVEPKLNDDYLWLSGLLERELANVNH